MSQSLYAYGTTDDRPPYHLSGYVRQVPEPPSSGAGHGHPCSPWVASRQSPGAGDGSIRRSQGISTLRTDSLDRDVETVRLKRVTLILFVVIMVHSLRLLIMAANVLNFVPFD